MLSHFLCNSQVTVLTFHASYKDGTSTRSLPWPRLDAMPSDNHHNVQQLPFMLWSDKARVLATIGKFWVVSPIVQLSFRASHRHLVAVLKSVEVKGHMHTVLSKRAVI